MKKDRSCIAIGVALLAGSVFLRVAANHISGFSSWYVQTIYPYLIEVMGRMFGVFPFSVFEVGLCLFLIWFLISRIKVIPKAILSCGVILFLYMVNGGVNYYAEPFSQYIGLEAGEYTQADLEELCTYLAMKVNENIDGAVETYGENKKSWKRESSRAMSALAQEFPVLSGYYPKPKEMMASAILSIQQRSGIYTPFTMEANYNGSMPDYNIPHTMCHELSHLHGFMREDEANFIGYLACIKSDNQSFRYSGYLNGWVHAANALADLDYEAYLRSRKELAHQAELDLQRNNQFWKRYMGKSTEVTNQWTDRYLKMNNQEAGILGYGQTVDLMLAYYQNGMDTQETETEAGGNRK